jgi:hypothetical protein
MGPGSEAGTTWVGCLDSFFKQQPMHRHGFVFSRHTAPEFCKFVRPKKKRAQGRPGARCTRGLACQDAQSKNAHEHTGSAETLRPSLRDGVTAYSVLSPARPELVCHRRPLDTKYHRELDTSHRGVRTTRLCRPHQPRSSVAAFASTAPRPNVSDDGQRPLSRDGMARNKQMIWVKSQGEFLKIRSSVEV